MARRRLLPGADARQGLVALALNSSTSLVAGAVLGSLTATFERRPGLLVLVPAAIGLRGNVFGSLGNRVSTSIHAGELQLRLRRSTCSGQNVLAAVSLTLGMSLILVFAGRARVASGSASAHHRLRRPGARLASVAARSASLPVLAATLGLAGGRRPLRLGPRQRHRSPRVHPRRRAHPARPLLRDRPARLRPRHLDARLGARRPRRSRRSWSACALARSRSCAASSGRRSRSSCSPGSVSSLAGVALERRLGDLQRPARRCSSSCRRTCRAPAPSAGSSRAGSRASSSSASPRPPPCRRAPPAATSGSSPPSASPSSSLNGAGAHFVARLLGEASPGPRAARRRLAARRRRRHGRRPRDRVLRHHRHRPPRDRPRHLRHPAGQLHRRPRRRPHPRHRHRRPRLS